MDKVISLRPTPLFVHAHSPIESNDDFVFSKEPILVQPYDDLPSDVESGDETDPEDHEARIRSSWHHRALIGDENRILYTDFQDTDFDAVEQRAEWCDSFENPDDNVVVFS